MFRRQYHQNTRKGRKVKIDWNLYPNYFVFYVTIMKHLLNNLLIILLLSGLAFSQFRAQVIPQGIPVNSQGLSQSQNLPIFNPSRFNMQHSFSLSMMNFSGQSLSLGAYTNQMNFMLKDNLRIQTQFSLIQPTGGLDPLSNNGLGGQVYYGASLDYQPTKNFLVSLSLNNYPRYGFYRPYSRLSMTR